MDTIELSEKMYKEVLKGSPNAIIIHENGVCICINESGKKLFKAEKDDDIINKKIMDFVDLEFKNIFEDYLFNDLNNKPLECKFIVCDNSIIYADIVAINISNNDTMKHMILFKNKTENKILTNRTQFFIDMSHELKTPLNVVLSSLQMIDLYQKKENTADNLERISYYNKVIKANCYSLLKIINNLIDINKIECGKIDTNIFNYDIVKIVEDNIEAISNIVRDNGIKFRFNKEIDQRIVACDKDKIERIVFNLVSNAIKFTKPGGEIHISIYIEDEYVCISVKDTGIGISKHNQKKIFKRYNKAECERNRSCSGNGLGLTIVKSMVEVHDGEIILESEEGLGTNFIVKIPDKQVDEDIIKDNYINTERFNIEFADIKKA